MPVYTVDTNLFVYALDDRDPVKQRLAIELLDRLRALDTAIALQCCGELHAALTRRLRRAPWEAAQAARNVMTAFPTFHADRRAVERALAEAAAGRFSYWDAVLLAAAHQAEVRYCFSQDMPDGARLGSVEVVNPFTETGLSERAAKLVRPRGG